MASIPLVGLSGLQNQPQTVSGFIGGLGAAADIRTSNANADLATANADKAKAEGRMTRLSIANNLLRSISAAPEDQRAGRLEQGKAAIARMYPDIGDLSWLTLDNMDAVQGALTDTTQQFEEMIKRGEFDLKTRDTENAIYNRDRKVTSDINVNGAQIANYRSQIGDRDRAFAAGRYDADRNYGLAYDKAIATGYGTVPAGAMMTPDGSVKVHIDPESGLPLSSDIAKSRVSRAGQVPQGYEYRPGDGSILRLTDTEGSPVAGGGGANSAPTGYRWTGTGDLEAIPGGPAALVADKARREQEAATEKATSRTTILRAQADDVIGSIDDALAKVNSGGVTGVGGWIGRRFPGSDSTDLAGDIETITANLGFDRLQQMRDMSPTGGALGQVAVQELLALKATVASLDLNQSKEQVQKNLQKIRQHYVRWLEVMDEAAGGGASGGGGASPTPGPQPGQIESGYRFKGGDPADPASWEPV